MNVKTKKLQSIINAQNAQQWAKKLFHIFLEILYPPVCVSCGAEVEQTGLLCSACFAQTWSVTQPFCRSCAMPQKSAAFLGESGLCFSCETHPPIWGQARAAFTYTSVIRRLILQFKYSDREEHAAFLGTHMAQAGADLLKENTLLVPVPVHRWRLLQRKYNQAAWLARHIAQISGADYMPDALLRRHKTARLARFSRRERQHEMRRAIVARASRQALLAGRHVILVDDVLTTGATATACTEALYEVGVSHVDVLVAAVVLIDPENNAPENNAGKNDTEKTMQYRERQ
ncbi:MAG: ComF family protein [Acetobacter sp.]|nr:ComF family protein [Acetobacter sp.]